MTQSLPVTLAGVAFWDRPSASFVVKAISSIRPVATALCVGARVPLSRMPWGPGTPEILEPVVVELEPVEAGASTLGEPTARALHSLYVVPIQAGDETIGVLTLGEMRGLEREPFTAEKWGRCKILLDEFLAGTSHAWQATRLQRQLVAMSSMFRLVRQVLEAHSYDDLLACCASDIADWLAAPVGGVLFRVRSGDGLEIVARRHIPESLTTADIAQLVSALVRAARPGEWSVGIASVAHDPLDPMHAATEPGEAWTRISLPLMQDDRLLGVLCLYVGEELLPGQLELEALRRRGEIAAFGVSLVESREEHQRERERLGRTAWELLTTHQRTVLHQTLVGVVRLVSSFLKTRLERWSRERDVAPEGVGGRRQFVDAVTDEIGTVLGELVESVGAWDEGTPGPVEINQLVRHAMEIARAKWEEGPRRLGVTLELSCELADGPLMAQASMALVGVFVHAIENAVEAMPSGGRLRLRTARDDGHVLISVDDTGAGVAEELRHEVFTPLFSTKGKPHLGLGLSVVRAFVMHYGGSVSLVSAGPGGGSSLEIRLPVVSGAGVGG